MITPDRQEFYVRTFGFGARTGMVVGILAIILGVIMKAVTPENPLYLRFIIFGAFIYLFTRHYRWPFIVVTPDSIAIGRSMWRKKYWHIKMTDPQNISISENAITFSPINAKPLTVQRRLFKPAVWQRLKDAVSDLEKNHNLKGVTSLTRDMPKFLYQFGVIPPQESALARKRKSVWDYDLFQDTLGLFIVAPTKEQAQQWGDAVALKFMQVLYHDPAAQNTGWIVEDADDIREWQKIPDIPVVQYGQLPDIESMVREAQARWEGKSIHYQNN